MTVTDNMSVDWILVEQFVNLIDINATLFVFEDYASAVNYQTEHGIPV